MIVKTLDATIDVMYWIHIPCVQCVNIHIGSATIPQWN